MPESYRKLPKHISKKKIQASLIVSLETLDSYADISTLTSEIKKGMLRIIQSLLTNIVIEIDFFNAFN